MRPAELATIDIMRRFGKLTRAQDGFWYPDGMGPATGGVAAQDAIVRALAEAGHVAIAASAGAEIAKLAPTRAAA